MNEQQDSPAGGSSWAWTVRLIKGRAKAGPRGRPSPPAAGSRWHPPTMAGDTPCAHDRHQGHQLGGYLLRTTTEAAGDAVDRAGAVPVDTRVREGDAARGLVDPAEGANLLIVGSGVTADSPASSWARSAGTARTARPARSSLFAAPARSKDWCLTWDPNTGRRAR
jgi:hypothetical protein